MFSKKYPILFISKNFIEPGEITLSREPSFAGGEAVSYAPETLKAALEHLSILKGKTIRIVLAEELVYVTALPFPRGTSLTREIVRTRAEEVIPEDLRMTKWDFRTMRYVKQREIGEEVLVQVAVIEHAFASVLEDVLQSKAFKVANILPESYALASFSASEEGITVIVEQDRENVLMLACEYGLVLSTEVRKEAPTLDDVLAFLKFVEQHASKKVARVVFSHGNGQLMRESLEQAGYGVLEQEYNPLLTAVFEKVSGHDENILNLAVSDPSSFSWWRNMFGKKAS